MSNGHKTPSNGVRQRLTSPRITIVITAEIIAQSVARHSGHCFIAEAIRAAYPHFTTVTVDLATIRFSDPEKRLRYIYLTPRIVQVAIILFDRGEPPEPFRFVLWRAAQITRNMNWNRSKPSRPKSSPPKSSPSESSPSESSPSPNPTAFPSLGPKRTQREGGGSGSIPTVIGGNPPPFGLLLGRAIRRGEDSNGAYFAPGNIAKRREFGVFMLRY